MVKIFELKFFLKEQTTFKKINFLILIQINFDTNLYFQNIINYVTIYIFNINQINYSKKIN